MFALKGGISSTQSPSEIVLNRRLNFNAHCKIEFGQYPQTHEEHDNSMAAYTVGAIATCPTGNAQGGYYFIRLDTGRHVNRKDWTPLLMPKEVVDQVHRLARRAKAKKNLTFTNENNEDLNVLYASLSKDDDDESINDDNDSITGVDDTDEADNDDDEDNSNYDPTQDDDNDGDNNDEPAQDNDDDKDNDDDNTNNNNHV